MICNRWLYLATVVMSMMLLVATAFLHLLNWSDVLKHRGVYVSNAEATWARLAPELVHSQWLLYMWVAVYVLQLAWLIHGVELVVRRQVEGNLFPAYMLLPVPVYVLFMVSLPCTVGCHVLWTHPDLYSYAPILLLLTVICTFMALCLAAVNMARYDGILRHTNNKWYLWQNRLLVQNCLGAYASMATVILLYQVVVNLAWVGSLSQGGHVYVFLAILQLYMVLWAVLDLVLCHYCDMVPYLLAPYILVLVSLIQTLHVQANNPSVTRVVAGLCLTITAAFTIARVTYTIVKATCLKQTTES